MCLKTKDNVLCKFRVIASTILDTYLQLHFPSPYQIPKIFTLLSKEFSPIPTFKPTYLSTTLPQLILSHKMTARLTHTEFLTDPSAAPTTTTDYITDLKLLARTQFTNIEIHIPPIRQLSRQFKHRPEFSLTPAEQKPFVVGVLAGYAGVEELFFLPLKEEEAKVFYEEKVRPWIISNGGEER